MKNDAGSMVSPRNAADAVPEVHAKASLCALHRSTVDGAGDCPRRQLIGTRGRRLSTHSGLLVLPIAVI